MVDHTTRGETPDAGPPRRLAPHRGATALIAALTILTGACGDAGNARSSSSPDTTTQDAATTTGAPTSAAGQDAPRHFKVEVWADNWFSLYVNGNAIGEDSVPITTERSFNAETIDFDATYPLTIAMVSKDFKENDTGLEYIGTDRQQMGDGGFIVQITDTSTGKVVAVTDANWRGLVVQRAPLDTACETSPNPATDCSSESIAEPAGWTTASFDDTEWVAATVYTDAEVQPHGDYSTITWDPAAKLIWTSSLTQDNTILWRSVVTAP